MKFKKGQINKLNRTTIFEPNKKEIMKKTPNTVIKLMSGKTNKFDINVNNVIEEKLYIIIGKVNTKAQIVEPKISFVMPIMELLLPILLNNPPTIKPNVEKNVKRKLISQKIKGLIKVNMKVEMVNPIYELQSLPRFLANHIIENIKDALITGILNPVNKQ